MRIQFLGGGLANQIRQYVFVRYAERRCPEETWLFDDSYFYMPYALHNGYELEKVFGIKANLISNWFGTDTWGRVMKQIENDICLPQIFLDAGVSVAMLQGPSFRGYFNGSRIKNSGFHPEIVSLPYNNLYYFDCGAEDDWFQQYREENLAELTFPELRDDRNIAYAAMIRDHMSVGIHVRRGDFVTLGWNVPEDEYRAACKRVLDEFPDAWFFIISDDLDWCQKNEEKLGFNLAGSTRYIKDNNRDRSYIDMQLLSMCRGIIRPAKSSFSQVAVWLNRNLEFEIKLGKTRFEEI